VVDGFEDAAVAVIDAGADVQLGIDPHDGRGGSLAADVDTDPDVFAVDDVGLADACLPRPGAPARTLRRCPSGRRGIERTRYRG
jgi:hypothetical protein